LPVATTRPLSEILPKEMTELRVRPIFTLLLEVRIVLKTDDDAIIGMSYPGLRHGPKEVLDRIARGEVVKATDYYLRISATFETASEKYGWLNNIISVGVGHRLPEGPIYQMFEVL
jgi:hypothetical protein